MSLDLILAIAGTIALSAALVLAAVRWGRVGVIRAIEAIPGNAAAVAAAVMGLISAALFGAISGPRRVPEPAVVAPFEDVFSAAPGPGGSAPKPGESFAGPSSETAKAAPALPDVDTMIGKLKSRLERDGGDAKGWRMLGWSYARTGRYDDAKAAYEHALSLDPADAETKAGLEEVRKQLTAGAAPAGETVAAPALEQDDETVVNQMVERLAQRLAAGSGTPEDWLSLIRARKASGSIEQAREALRGALERFAGDAGARERITDGAKRIGIEAGQR